MLDRVIEFWPGFFCGITMGTLVLLALRATERWFLRKDDEQKNEWAER
jgi:hypothetical protein